MVRRSQVQSRYDEKKGYALIIEVGLHASGALSAVGFCAAAYQRKPGKLDVIKHHIEAWDQNERNDCRKQNAKGQ